MKPKKPLKRSTKPLKRSPLKRKAKKYGKSLRYELILDGAVRKYPDEREICQNTFAGKQEYAKRLADMIYRQGKICCICKKERDSLGLWGTWTFEHSDLRGMGGARRDDRTEIDGKPVNGAAHFWCNAIKGSKR